MTTKEVFEKNNDNEELAKKLMVAKKPEQVYEILKAEGLTDSFDDFKAAATEINEANLKLSEGEIDGVVGGLSTGDVGSIVVSSLIGGASAAACV